MVSIRETTSIKLDRDVKLQAKVILDQLGLSMGDAVNIFLKQVVLNRAIPFELKLPNDETLEVMRDIDSGKNIDTFNLDELK